jgi:hypothetical protein
MEIVNNQDGTLSIYSTVLDHKSSPLSMANAGRFLSVVDIQVGLASDQTGLPLDRNVELIVPLTDLMKAKLLPIQGHSRIESLTTLQNPSP